MRKGVPRPPLASAVRLHSCLGLSNAISLLLRGPVGRQQPPPPTPLGPSLELRGLGALTGPKASPAPVCILLWLCVSYRGCVYLTMAVYILPWLCVSYALFLDMGQ